MGRKAGTKMTGISYREIEQAKDREVSLRAQLRADLRAKRAEVKALKVQLVSMKAEDRSAQYAAILADGGTEYGGRYAVKMSGKRGVIIPKDASQPVTRGDSALIRLILSSLAV